MTPVEFATLLRRPFSFRGSKDENGIDYLLRINLTPKLRWYRRHFPSAFLHHFFRGDKDGELHNHDWRWAISFVLTGGYKEERMEGRMGVIREVFFRPGRINILFKETFHRIELDDPKKGCWTLIITAPKPDDTETWGFVDPETREFELAIDRFAREREGRAA